MSIYRVPLAEAHARLGENMDYTQRNHQADIVTEQARTLSFGRRVAAQAIVHTLGNEDPERRIGHTRRGRKATAEYAGWVLCEYVADVSQGSSRRYDLDGLLLGRDSVVYGYRANLSFSSGTASSDKLNRDVTAWGRHGLALMSGKNEDTVACRSIEVVDLMADTVDVDRQVGPYAGSLSLDDLFAGLIVRVPVLSDKFGEEIHLPGGPGAALTNPE